MHRPALPETRTSAAGAPLRRRYHFRLRHQFVELALGVTPCRRTSPWRIAPWLVVRRDAHGGEPSVRLRSGRRRPVPQPLHFEPPWRECAVSPAQTLRLPTMRSESRGHIRPEGASRQVDAEFTGANPRNFPECRFGPISAWATARSSGLLTTDPLTRYHS